MDFPPFSATPAEAPNQELQRPKGYRIYFLLAIFDLFTILLSLYLNHKIMGIYTDSVSVNHEWSDRSERYSRLRQLAGTVNAPGNDVFDSRDVKAEREKMQKARGLFDAEMSAIREDLIANVSGREAEQLLKGLDEIEAAMDEMTAEANLIFSFFSDQDSDSAGERMATMDRKYHKVNTAFSLLNEKVHFIQDYHFAQQMKGAAFLQQFEYVIAGMILLMVAGATFYGHKLSQQALTAAREKEAHLQALRAGEERFQIVARATNDAVWDWDLISNQLWWNQGIQTLFLYSADEVAPGVAWWGEHIHPEDRERVVSGIHSVIDRGGQFWSDEYRFLRGDGAYADILDRGYVVHDGAGGPVRMIGAMMDMTERRRVQKQLEMEISFVRLLQIVAVAANEASTVEEAMQIVTYQICAHIKWPAGHVYLASGGPLKELVSTAIWHMDNPPQFEEFRRVSESMHFSPKIGLPGRVLDSGEPAWIVDVTRDANFPRAKQAAEAGIQSGFAFPIMVGSEVAGVLEFFSSRKVEPDKPLLEVMGHIGTLLGRVIERRRAVERLHYSANYDSLTHLPNRALFYDRLSQALARAPWHKRWVAVLFLDLDRFKTINDTLGHHIGDRLLEAVAKRLSASIRDGDTVSRLGGDEFTIILDDVARAEDVTKIAEKVLNAMAQPFCLEGHELFVTTSIGISVYPHDGNEAGALLKNADIAMYRAKEQGRNNYQHYSSAMNSRTLERLELENGLRRAIERGELLLHYQPQVDLVSGRIVGMEALVRWRHPEKGLIPPAQFIPIAEETGLILPIGEWILRAACAQNKAWQTSGLPRTRIAVNISPLQFRQKNFLDLVVRILKETELDPSFLEMEVTETVLMQKEGAVIDCLGELNALGILLSIDDFGTGYSSLSYLKRLPIQKLKVDRSFVRSVTVDANDAVIARTIVVMAHSLHLKAIAEGVETKEQLAFFRSVQCDEAQGYLFSPPLAPEEAAKRSAVGAFPPDAWK